MKVEENDILIMDREFMTQMAYHKREESSSKPPPRSQGIKLNSPKITDRSPAQTNPCNKPSAMKLSRLLGIFPEIDCDDETSQNPWSITQILSIENVILR